MLSSKEFFDIVKLPILIGAIMSPAAILFGKDSILGGTAILIVIFVMPVYVGRKVAKDRSGGLFDAAVAGVAYGAVVDFVHVFSGILLDPSIREKGILLAILGSIMVYAVFLAISMFFSMGGSLFLVGKKKLKIETQKDQENVQEEEISSIDDLEV